MFMNWFFAAEHIDDSVHTELDEPVIETHSLLNSKKTTVHNVLGNIRFECTVEKPKSLKELVDVIVKAKQEKQNVRAVGAFHAWS